MSYSILTEANEIYESRLRKYTHLILSSDKDKEEILTEAANERFGSDKWVFNTQMIKFGKWMVVSNLTTNRYLHIQSDDTRTTTETPQLVGAL